ncbi:hypothetical protein ACFQ60_36715 [Streptomyces zhihengii]
MVPTTSPYAPSTWYVDTPPAADRVTTVATRSRRHSSVHRAKERAPPRRAARYAGTPPCGSSRSTYTADGAGPEVSEKLTISVTFVASGPLVRFSPECRVTVLLLKGCAPGVLV